MACRLCPPALATLAVKLADVVPPLVLRAAVAFGAPSTVSVTLPVGATVPAGGVPTATVTVTVNDAPTIGVVVDGVTVGVVVLGWMLMVSTCEVTAAYVLSPL